MHIEIAKLTIDQLLSPILMTAGTTALGLLPLLVSGEKPGPEIEHAMAVVIVGGLRSSTFLTLFVLPAVYGRFQTQSKVNAIF